LFRSIRHPMIIAPIGPQRQALLTVRLREKLSFTRCPDESFAGVLLSHVPQVLSERRCLMIEGITRLSDLDILYRSALYPLSDDGILIDHVLGATNYRQLRENEVSIAPFVRTKWL
jgi:hypothetical protein